MRNERLDRILAAARPAIAMHWSLVIEAGLGGHSPAAAAQLDARIEAFFERLKGLPEPAGTAAILAEIKTLFGELDAINDRAGGRLLETDERELLVPLIIDAAAASGLDPAEFDDDPTLQFRNF